MKEYTANLSQSERLAFSGASYLIPAASIGDDERESVTLSRPRFPMPCIAKVRENDARLTLRGSPCNVASEEESEEEESEEESLRAFAYDKRRDSLRENSLVLPSQRGYAEAWSEAYSCGFAND